MRKWLEKLDDGKGRILQFLEPLRKEFGDLRQVAACVVPGRGENGVLSAVDPLIFEVLGNPPLGQKLVLAKGIVALEEELAKKARDRGQAQDSQPARPREKNKEVASAGSGSKQAEPVLVPPPGLWTVPRASAPAELWTVPRAPAPGGGAGALPVQIGAWRTLDAAQQRPMPRPVPVPPRPWAPPQVRLRPAAEAPKVVVPPSGPRPFGAFAPPLRPVVPGVRPTVVPPIVQLSRPLQPPRAPEVPPAAPAKPGDSMDFDTKEAALHVLIELASSPWHDSRGSVYELTLDSGGTKMTVKTRRPDGRVVVTRNLIHLDPPKDGAGARICWGVKPSFVLKNPRASAGAPLTSASWMACEANRTPFQWSRGDKKEESAQSHR